MVRVYFCSWSAHYAFALECILAAWSKEKDCILTTVRCQPWICILMYFLDCSIFGLSIPLDVSELYTLNNPKSSQQLIRSFMYLPEWRSVAGEGWGRHSWNIPLSFLSDSYQYKTSKISQWLGDILIPWSQVQFASQILISPVKFVITSAIIIVYKLIFGVLKWFHIVSYGLYIFLFLLVWEVRNVGIIYWYTPRKGNANNIQAAFLRTEKTSSSAIANAVCSTTVDIVLFLFPMAVVHTLNMSSQKKRAIYWGGGFLELCKSFIWESLSRISSFSVIEVADMTSGLSVRIVLA